MSEPKPPADDAPASATASAELRMTDAELHRGIQFAHDLAMAALARAERAEAQLDALLGALKERGALEPSWTPPPSEELARSPLQQYQPDLEVSVAADPDKHGVPSPDIPCAELMPLCHGRCCRFRVMLTYRDVEDGLRYVYERPYELRREADGYCTYFDREHTGCTTYATRPAPCRDYDCRDSPSIWIDYERRIPAPMPEGLVQLRRGPR
ncbi:MAG: YkgJ family cysteine cluster protein [Kofleriaceae bacterium]